MSNNEIDDFLRAIEEIFAGMDPKTFWPLNGGQTDSYFDVDEALDMYYRLNKLKEKLSIKEIADLMPPADIIRLFLEHNAIIGLKVAKKLNIANLTQEQIIDYTLFLFQILKQKVKGDIFCLDGKNILLGKEETKEILFKTNWNKPLNKEENRQIASLIVTANNLCYTLFYDEFMAGGFYIHGPYNASEVFGKETILLIREYHNLKPIEIWPDLQIPYKTLRILGIYKNTDIKINFANHPTTTIPLPDKLIAYKVYLDDKEITIKYIESLMELFDHITSKQTKKINALSDLDKVRKGAEIAFYLFKKLRESMGDNWKPPVTVEATIQKFGDRFIKQFQYKEKPSLEHWKKIFDPRNNYY